MSADTVLTLFGTCPVPACGNPVDDDEPCAVCSEMIDEGFIREVPAPEPVTAEDARRELEAQRILAEAGRKADAAARRRAAEEGSAPMPGQVCWCCEERGPAPGTLISRSR